MRSNSILYLPIGKKDTLHCNAIRNAGVYRYIYDVHKTFQMLHDFGITRIIGLKLLHNSSGELRSTSREIHVVQATRRFQWKNALIGARLRCVERSVSMD